MQPTVYQGWPQRPTPERWISPLPARLLSTHFLLQRSPAPLLSNLLSHPLRLQMQSPPTSDPPPPLPLLSSIEKISFEKSPSFCFMSNRTSPNMFSSVTHILLRTCQSIQEPCLLYLLAGRLEQQGCSAVPGVTGGLTMLLLSSWVAAHSKILLSFFFNVAGSGFNIFSAY